jgi:hypothetical protein
LLHVEKPTAGMVWRRVEPLKGIDLRQDGLTKFTRSEDAFNAFKGGSGLTD